MKTAAILEKLHRIGQPTALEMHLRYFDGIDAVSNKRKFLTSMHCMKLNTPSNRFQSDKLSNPKLAPLVQSKGASQMLGCILVRLNISPLKAASIWRILGRPPSFCFLYSAYFEEYIKCILRISPITHNPSHTFQFGRTDLAQIHYEMQGKKCFSFFVFGHEGFCFLLFCGKVNHIMQN